MADKKFSELITAATVTDSGILAMSQDLNGSLASQKTTVGAVGTHIAKEMNFTADLQTTSKNIIGAINEAATSGGDTVTVTNTITPTTTTKKVADVNINSVANSIYADDAEKVLRQAFGEHTVTGNPITFDAYLGVEVAKSCEVTFSPIQSGSGEPSPSNVRPISGRDSLSLTRTGKNVLENNATTSRSQYYTLSVATDGVITLSGSSSYASLPILNFATDSSSTSLQNDNKKHIQNGQWKVPQICSNTGVRLQICCSNSEDTSEVITIFTGNSGTFTIDDTYKYNWVRLYINAGSYTNEKVYPMIIPSSATDTSYEPYNGQTHTATFSDTVYGGKWLPQEGKAVIEFVSVDMGDLSWELNATSKFVTSSSIGTKQLPNQTTLANILCSIYPTVTQAAISSNDKAICGLNWGDGRVLIYDTAYTDAQTFKTAMSGVQLCYELATPTEITLTAEQIELLKGQNVLFTDGDNITLTYNCDIKQWVLNQLQS